MVRKLARFGLIISCLAFAGFLCHGASKGSKHPKEDERLTALMAKLQSVQQGIQSLRLSFTQINSFNMLSKPQVLKGVLVIQKPSTALYVYNSPKSLFFRVKDGNLLVYKAAEKEAFVQDIRRHEGKIMRYMGITQPLEELKKSFRVTIASQRGNLVQLTLMPLKSKIQRKIAAIYFTIGADDGIIREFEIIEPGGDKIKFSFSDWEINPKLTEKDFELPIPTGVKVKRQMFDFREPFGK